MASTNAPETLLHVVVRLNSEVNDPADAMRYLDNPIQCDDNVLKGTTTASGYGRLLRACFDVTTAERTEQQLPKDAKPVDPEEAQVLDLHCRDSKTFQSTLQTLHGISGVRIIFSAIDMIRCYVAPVARQSMMDAFHENPSVVCELFAPAMPQ